MCDCTNTSDFAKAMESAKIVEKKTGKPQAVYTRKETGRSFFGTEEYVKTVEGICCYYLTSGAEIQIPMKSKTNTVKKIVKKSTKSKKQNAVPELPGTTDPQL